MLSQIPDHKNKSKIKHKIIALSFFSGALGLDVGMERAGIYAMLYCENNKACRNTIISNRPEPALIGDISQYTAKDIYEMAGLPEGQKIDVMFGGPPCQAFSTAGARRAFDDERGNVFLQYIELAGELRPSYLIIENVRGLLSAPYTYQGNPNFKGGALLYILDKLRSKGYSVSFNLYNAANFGAPQIRERIVIFAVLDNKRLPYLNPTNSEFGNYNLPKWLTLRDALNGLIVKEHHVLAFPEKRLKYYRMLKEGQYRRDLPADLQKEALGKAYHLGGGKTGFLRRVSFDKPSPTLVTNPCMPATDLAHPVEDRPLSVEEYRRIQGFPDDWIICGSLQDQYKQIGNAVPVKLGEAIGRHIISDMANRLTPPPYDFPFSRYKNTNEVAWEKITRSTLKNQNIHQGSLFSI